jgi:hypothetical protein
LEKKDYTPLDDQWILLTFTRCDNGTVIVYNVTFLMYALKYDTVPGICFKICQQWKKMELWSKYKNILNMSDMYTWKNKMEIQQIL